MWLQGHSNRRLAALYMILLICLSGCGPAGVTSQTRYSGESNRPQRRFTLDQRAAAFSEVEPLGATVAAALQRFSLPENRHPVLHGEMATVYCLDPSAERLYTLDLASGVEQPLLDLSGTGSTLAQEIACNDRFLIWIELSPWYTAIQGEPPWRDCRLKMRDLHSGTDSDHLLASTKMTALDQPELPYSHLNLQNDLLAYRISLSNGGARTTRIVMRFLPYGEERILAEARSESGRTLLSCHLEDNLLVWDLRTSYLENQGRLSPRERAVYDIYCFKLDPAQLRSDENPLRQLTHNDDYVSPRVYHQEIYAIQQVQGSIHHTSALVCISPLTSSTVTLVDYQTPFAGQILQAYAGLLHRRGAYDDLPLRQLSYSNPYIDSRFLSWQSNVADHHLLFDTAASVFVSLPLNELGDADHPADINMPSFWLRPLPSRTADALLLGFVGELEPRYLLLLG